MISAAEAYNTATRVGLVNDILKLAEDKISEAASEGNFECELPVSDNCRKYIEPAIKLIKDAGYQVDVKRVDVSEEADGSDWVHWMHINWENANL